MMKGKLYNQMQPKHTVDFYIIQPVNHAEYICIYMVICPGLEWDW